MDKNKIDIILPTFNGMPYLAEAIKSLLDQSYKNIMIHVIDNGSIDHTKDYIKSLNCAKIVYHYMPAPSLVDSLNYGLTQCHGKYIARMDADDISEPDRLEKQYNYLEDNPSVDVVGTQGRYFGNIPARSVQIKLPITHNEILNSMYSARHSIIHPSIMFRSELIDRGFQYKKDAFPCEDYELFLRLSSSCRFANLPDELYNFRITNNSIIYNHISKSIKLFYEYSHQYGNLRRNIILERINIMSLVLYRKGLYYYLNSSLFLGILYFSIASLINPIRAFRWMKRKMTTHLSSTI